MTERPILFSTPMVLALLAGRKTQTRRVVKLRLALDEEGDNVSDFVERGMVRRPALYGSHVVPCPYGVPGDRLWVRETWAFNGAAYKNYGPKSGRHEVFVTYAADNTKRTHYFPEKAAVATPKQTIPEQREDEDDWEYQWRRENYLTQFFRRLRPSIFMPRWASRIVLQVTEVRVERLQAISERDSMSEGIEEAGSSENVETSARSFSQRWRNYDTSDPTNTYCVDAKDSYRSLWESINGPGSWAANPWIWAITFKAVTS